MWLGLCGLILVTYSLASNLSGNVLEFCIEHSKLTQSIGLVTAISVLF